MSSDRTPACENQHNGIPNYSYDHYAESGSEDEQKNGQDETSVHAGFENNLYRQDIKGDPISRQNPYNQESFENAKKTYRHRSTKSQTIMQPLVLSSEGGSFVVMRQERFKSMIANSIRPRLSSLENSKFLERFRYLLVSSPLLDKHLSAYTARHTRNTSSTTNSDSKNGLYKRIIGLCSCIPVSVIKQRYWIDGGGCIIVMVVLLSWAVKTNKHGLRPGTSQHGVALIVITFGITLFLFSHTRRRVLRYLRTRVLANTTHFVDNSQKFDQAITKCISTIREAELMSRGYRPDLALNPDGFGISMSSHIVPPSSRIEKSATERNGIIMGKHLRSSISAGLYLSTSTTLSAIQEILPFCNHTDLEKYLDIYELDISVMDEFGWERVDGTDPEDRFARLIERSLNVPREEFFGITGANASLQKIKFDLFKFHFLRRLLTCCLLSMPTTGSCTGREVDSWHLVNSHLEACSNLMNQLSQTLTPNRVITSIGLDTDTSTPVDDVVLPEMWQQQVRSLNHITSTLQHIEARMEMLRDSSIAIINSASTPTNAAKDTNNPNYRAETTEIYGIQLHEEDFREVEDDFGRNFDIIGKDIKSLLNLWESGKKDFDNAVKTRRGNMPLSVSTDHGTSQEGAANFYEEDNMTLFSPTALGSESVLSSSGPGNTSVGVGVGISALLKDFDFSARHHRQSSELTSFSGATVLEGISDHQYPRSRGGDLASGGNSKVLRQERIKKMQQERANEIERRAALQQKSNLVLELGSVLDYRRRTTAPSSGK